MIKFTQQHLLRLFKRLRVKVILYLLLGLWSLVLGWGMALALERPTQLDSDSLPSPLTHLKSVDPVPTRYQPGYELYLETCSSCHIALPPGVLPSESWKKLLEEPDDHYGEQLTELIRITQLLIWEYLSTFSRPLLKDEPLPLYVERSRYFRALHPRVDLPDPTTSKTCLTCHPNASQFDYRTLTPEWEDAP